MAFALPATDPTAPQQLVCTGCGAAWAVHANYLVDKATYKGACCLRLLGQALTVDAWHGGGQPAQPVVAPPPAPVQLPWARAVAVRQEQEERQEQLFRLLRDV